MDEIVPILSADEYIEKIGSCSYYQILVGHLISLMHIPMVYQVLIMYFTGHSPNWKCKNGKNGFCNITGEVSAADVDKFNSRCSMPRDSWEYVTPRSFSLVTEFDLICKRNPMAAFANSALYLGWGFGCIPLGAAADHFGRKPLIFISYIVVLLSVFASAYVTAVWQFVVLRFVSGVGITGSITSSFVFLSEVVGKRCRSVMGKAFLGSGTISLLLLTLQAYYLPEWRKLTKFSAAPYLILIFFWWFIHESPRWLSGRGQLWTSVNALKKMAKTNRHKFPVALIEFDGALKNSRGTFFDLFKPKSRLKDTALLSYGWMIVAMAYYGISLSASDLTGNFYRDFALMTVIDFPAMPVTVILLERIGRRKTTVISMILSGFFCCSIILFPEESSIKGHTILRIVAGIAGKLFNVIAFSAYYIWTAELYPTMIRSRSLSFTSLLARVGSAIAPFISQVLRLVSSSLPFAIMGIFSISAGILSIWIPETRGQPSLESTDQLSHATSDLPSTVQADAFFETAYADEDIPLEENIPLMKM